MPVERALRMMGMHVPIHATPAPLMQCWWCPVRSGGLPNGRNFASGKSASHVGYVCAKACHPRTPSAKLAVFTTIREDSRMEENLPVATLQGGAGCDIRCLHSGSCTPRQWQSAIATCKIHSTNSRISWLHMVMLCVWQARCTAPNEAVAPHKGDSVGIGAARGRPPCDSWLKPPTRHAAWQ